MKSKNHVWWMSAQAWPTYVGFCPSERAYKKYLKEHTQDKDEYPRTGGHVKVFENEKERSITVLVFIGDHVDKSTDRVGIAAIIAHECMHVMQRIHRDMGVRERDDEVEAYTLQNLMHFVMDIYNQTRVKRF